MNDWFERWKRASEDRWLQAWEHRRRMGFLGFVLVWGLGRMGLLGGTLWVIAMSVLVMVWFDPLDKVVWKGLIGLSIWIPAGVWMSVWIWFDTEKKYKRMMREAGREPAPAGMGDPDVG